MFYNRKLYRGIESNRIHFIVKIFFFFFDLNSCVVRIEEQFPLLARSNPPLGVTSFGQMHVIWRKPKPLSCPRYGRFVGRKESENECESERGS